MVIVSEIIEDESFRKLIHFIEKHNEDALILLKDLRKDPKNHFPYTQNWDLRL